MIERRLLKVLLPLVVLLLAAVAIFSSCASVPAPKSGTDSLLVLPVEPDRESGGNVFGYYQLSIVDVADPKNVAYVNIYAGSKTKLIGGLEAGRYRIEKMEFKYKNGGSGNTYALKLPAVTLEAGCATIAPIVFQPQAYKKNPDDRTAWMRMKWSGLSPEKKKAVIAELSEEENFRLWKLSD